MRNSSADDLCTVEVRTSCSVRYINYAVYHGWESLETKISEIRIQTLESYVEMLELPLFSSPWGSGFTELFGTCSQYKRSRSMSWISKLMPKKRTADVFHKTSKGLNSTKSLKFLIPDVYMLGSLYLYKSENCHSLEQGYKMCRNRCLKNVHRQKHSAFDSNWSLQSILSQTMNSNNRIH